MTEPPKDPATKGGPPLIPDLTFEVVRDMIKRRIKIGKTSLRLAVPSPASVAEIGRWYASCPGFRSSLKTIHHYSLNGRDSDIRYELLVDWSAPLAQNLALMAPRISVEPYVPYPQETTVVKFENSPYNPFKPEVFELKE